METVTSEFSPTGTKVRFRLVADVVVDGRVVAPAGALVTGLVREAVQAGANDKPGVLEVTVPGLKAMDGGQVPLIAQLAASGPEDDFAASAAQVGESYGGPSSTSTAVANTAAAVAGVAGGLIGGGLVGGIVALSRRGRETYYLAGERLRIWTREEAWLKDASATPAGDDSEPPSREEPHPSPDLVSKIEARCPETVHFTPTKGYRPSDIRIDLAVSSRPVDVAVTSVVDFVLTEPLPAKGCHAHDGGWSCTFDGWGLTRYLRVGFNAAQAVTLSGRTEGGGGPFTATAAIDYQVER
jgi:hypothetical protein